MQGVEAIKPESIGKLGKGEGCGCMKDERAGDGW